MVISRDITIS